MPILDDLAARLEEVASLLHAANGVNETALHCACHRQRLEVVERLLTPGARIDALARRDA